MKTRRVFALVMACLAASCQLNAFAGTDKDAPAPIEPRLFAVPVMEPGKPAWVSVYDQLGRPVPHAMVSLNGSAIEADNMGQASFTVPETTVMTLGVQGDEGKLVSTSSYERTPGGFLVAEKDAKEAVDRIEESIVSNELAPSIAYAPSVIETSQAFVLMGKNWSGKADGDHILVDGYDADVFSGSSVCLLATTPRRMSVGALREMYVTTGDETSNTVEVDVCKLDLSVIQDGTNEIARVRALGTNVPSLIDLRNLTPDTVSFKFGPLTLGRRSALITSGGEVNAVELQVVRKQTGVLDVDTHLVADAPWSPDDRATYGDGNKRKIIAELNRAEVIRLKRRLIAIENRIGEEQEKRTKALSEGTLTANAVDKANAQLRSLSNRQRRINAMVVARRAVYQSLGGTEDNYRKALDEAAGGGPIALEKHLAPLSSASLLASTSAAQAEANAKNHGIEQALNIDRKKEMQQLAELTRMWKQFPNKIAHGTRLAPPPPPVIPKLKDLDGGEEISFDYRNYVKLGAPPPPPPLMALIRQQRAKHHSARTSHSRKHSHSRQRSKSRRR